MNRRFVGGVVAVTFAGLLSLRLLGTAHAQEPLVLGVLLPISGTFAPLGEDMRNATLLAIEDFGPINGRPVKGIVEDSQGNPQVGVTKAQKLVQQDRVIALTGITVSSVALALSAQGGRLNVPMVSTNAQSVEVTGVKCSRYMFRTNPNDAMIAKGAVILFKNFPELKKVGWYVVTHDYVWGRSNASQFMKVPGVKVLGQGFAPLDTSDWAPHIAQARATNAGGVYLAVAVGNTLVDFIRQARNFGLKAVLMPPLGMPDSMVAALGEHGVGLRAAAMFGTWTLQETNPKMKRFVEAYVKKFGKVPGMQSIQAYNGTWLLLQAIKDAGATDVNSIIASLERVKVDGILGPTSIRPEDHQGRVGVYNAEIVKLEKPQYGAQYAWKVLRAASWEEISTPIAETGCSMQR